MGGILQMVNHGLSTGALFLLIGMIYERRHSRLIADFGGLWAVVPVFSVILLVVTLSSIGLPGLNGFVGEFLILLGAFQWSRPAAVLGTAGIVFAAVYLLWMYQRVIFGEVRHEENRRLPDLNAREIWTLVPILDPDRVDRGLPEALHGRDGDGGGRAAPGRAGQAGGAAGDGVADAGGAGTAVTAGLPTLAWPALYPVLIVTVACFACLLLDATPRGARPGVLAATGVLGVAGAVVVSLPPVGRSRDRASRRCWSRTASRSSSTWSSAGATVLVLLLSVGYLPRLGVEPGEYYALLLFATVGMMLMAAGTDLLVIFLALELMSLSLYVLAGTFRTRPEGERGGAEVLPARRLRERLLPVRDRAPLRRDRARPTSAASAPRWRRRAPPATR